MVQDDALFLGRLAVKRGLMDRAAEAEVVEVPGRDPGGSGFESHRSPEFVVQSYLAVGVLLVLVSPRDRASA